MKKMVFLLYVIGVAMFLECSTHKEYKTMTNNEIDGYFIVRYRIPYLDDTGTRTLLRDGVLKVFTIGTGEVEYYDLYKVLGLYYNFDAAHNVNTGEKISRLFFTPDRNYIAFSIYGTDSNGIRHPRNQFKTVQLNLKTGETQVVLLPEYCEPLSMPDEKTWLYLDYTLEKSEGKVFYKLWDMDTSMSRTIYTIADITKSESTPHNFNDFYDLQNRVLIFKNYYLDERNVYFYFEDEEKLELCRFEPLWNISMYNSNVIIKANEEKGKKKIGSWYAYNLGTREYIEFPFKSSVIYPIAENLFFFKEFMPVRNGLFLESTHYFKLGIYDSEKSQVVARWFDNRTSYDPHVPEFVPQINIPEQYKIDIGEFVVSTN